MTETKGKPQKGKRGKVIMGIAVVIVIFIITLMVYKVDVTEYVVVTQFGNPVVTVTQPGLNFKLPDPIQSVQRLDNRVQVYQTNRLEFPPLTKKGYPIDYYETRE